MAKIDSLAEQSLSVCRPAKEAGGGRERVHARDVKKWKRERGREREKERKKRDESYDFRRV